MKKTSAPRSKLTDTQFELIAKALADPRRMALLEAIAGEEECACQKLRKEFPVSKATISFHIKELVRAGLIEARKEGQFLQWRFAGRYSRHTARNCCAGPAERKEAPSAGTRPAGASFLIDLEFDSYRTIVPVG